MADILEKIAAYKREEIAVAKRDRPLASLEEQAKAAPPPSGFLRAIEQRIAFELLFDIIGEFEIRKLQQLDRLLQLRRHDQRLALPHFESLCQRHVPPPPTIRYSEKRSPR